MKNPVDSMIGKTISHYRILERLGSGGMGVVYKAEDIKLKRAVALKFLSPLLVFDDEVKQRFVYEAQAASALDHPHIATIYEIDDAEDGQMFIAMAYYDGETLKKKIGELRLAAAVDFAIQIAEGLAEAHANGIVHRDIKPANIIITKKGVVKIVDFGLAKLATLTTITRSGMTMGTPAYMSPEQVKGQKADLRTDIWSFGVVLYEMLTAQLPFRGEYEQAISHAIIYEAPIPASKLNREIPAGLERVINKALQKSPENRYASMQALLNDLRQVRPLLAKTQDQPSATVTLETPKEKPVVDKNQIQPQQKVQDLPNLRRPKSPDEKAIKFRYKPIAVASAVVFTAIFVGLWLLPKLNERTESNQPPGQTKTTLSIDTTPDGTTVLLNDNSVGVTPLQLAIELEGKIALRLQKRDYFTLDTSVIITKGRAEKFSFTLKKKETATPPQLADRPKEQMPSMVERAKLYDRYRNEGDVLFRQGKYDEAKQKYQTVLTQKPGDSYAIDQIKACNQKISELAAKQAVTEQNLQIEEEGPPPDFVPYDKEPQIVKRVNPVYPEIARKAGLEGTVWVKIWVGKDGKPQKVVIQKSASEIFDQAAIDAANQYLFTPAMIQNKPVDVWVSIPFHFRLK